MNNEQPIGNGDAIVHTTIPKRYTWGEQDIPQGSILHLQSWYRCPTFMYNGEPVCDKDSDTTKKYLTIKEQ